MPKLYKDITRELQFNIFYEPRCKNTHQNISKLNLVMYKKELYSTTKWNLSKVCKVDQTFKNQ